MAITGMRLGELLNARRGDIKQDQTLYVPFTKTDRPRIVPLTQKALETLKHLRQDAPDEELIFDPIRTGRHRRQMMVCFERAVKDAGIRDFHFHDLRHTFVTRLRADGVHEMDIMTLPGHTTLKVTQGYAHSVPNVLRTAVSSLERGRLLTFTPTSRQVVREAEG